MEYRSTRGSGQGLDAAEAILTGLAPDGGLFVPKKCPKIDLEALLGKDYVEVALAVLQAFLPDYSKTFLKEALQSSYGAHFEGKAGYLTALSSQLYSLELWHGPTAAFKDYALQLMPKLLVEARRMLGRQDTTLILVATSGDTGKAALEGFKDMPGTAIAVFYPNQGVSEIQKLQMTTQEGENVAVFAIEGNFDDAQRGVKKAFGDRELADTLERRGVRLSSANSINWGRLVPQVVYYVTSYLQLCRKGVLRFGELLDFCVPTGNFGDIMAGWYAKQMGLPVGRLVCASNQNNVLTEFFKTGHYNANRPFYKTSSPSMDILVSSNLERLLFHASGDDEAVRGWMKELAEKGQYEVGKEVLANIQGTFSAGYADEETVGEEIRRVYEAYGYLCDPHTAVAFRVLHEGGALPRPTVVLSTASPYKFCEKVLEALGQQVPADPFEAIGLLEKTAKGQAPKSLTSLQGKAPRFTQTLPADEIAKAPLRLFPA
ncbi:threonine synthase [Ruminococcaceae bacterium OttesenSCG-928-I18]|nr:threonine synthase [Ruminococcaceae bacterium OttesenSCG-928-I18]